ncbi:MAG: imidazole glycerol phosphate synthase subunit HisH [Bacteroidota bacterium]
MKVAIINYNAGNVLSVRHALSRLGVEGALTADHEEIRSADKVIFPGVGEAQTTMAFLRQRGLDDLIRSLRQPVLGICLGMQLLCEHSEEGDTACLGIIPQRVRRFQPLAQEKVPHIGWNQINPAQDCFLAPIETGAYVYFVHSYYVEPGPYTAANSHYILPFSSALQKDNFYATQFHPEKSGGIGEQILRCFLDI